MTNDTDNSRDDTDRDDTDNSRDDWLKTSQVADYLAVSYETVLGHIRLGTLPAIDVSASTSTRRKAVYRVRRSDLDAFIDARRMPPPPPPRKPRRHRVQTGDVIEFF